MCGCFVNLSLKSHSGGDTLLQLRSEQSYSKHPAGRFEGEQTRTTLLCPCQPFKMSYWEMWASFPSSQAPEAPDIKCILCATLTPNLWDQTGRLLWLLLSDSLLCIRRELTQTDGFLTGSVGTAHVSCHSPQVRCTDLSSLCVSCTLSSAESVNALNQTSKQNAAAVEINIIKLHSLILWSAACLCLGIQPCSKMEKVCAQQGTEEAEGRFSSEIKIYSSQSLNSSTHTTKHLQGQKQGGWWKSSVEPD